MKITYAPFHRWYKDAVEQPETLFGKKNQKRILSTLPRVDELAITHKIEPLTEMFLAWFTPLYTETIAARANADIHNVRKETLENTESLSTYWSLTVLQNNEIIGGTIFGIREDRLMVAFKAYPQKWSDGTLQANPTLYSEYILSRYAYEQGKALISHGRDRNPYGVNAAIGLATFKLSVGYALTILENNEDYPQMTLETDELKTDALVIHFPESGNSNTKATLITSRENESKYAQVLSYPELLTVDTIYRD